MKRRILSLALVLVLCMAMALTAYAASDEEPENAGELFVIDDAMLLSESEVAALNAKLQEISSTYQVQIVVSTIDALDDIDIDEFIEFAYDEIGLGYGSNRDGVLLLVCMDPREYRILTNGLADAAIGSSGIDEIGEAIVSDLSDGNYADAFAEFADRCEYYLDGHINGYPFNVGRSLLIALGIGLVAGFLVAKSLQSQLITVRKQEKAHSYVKAGSMQVTDSKELFLYRTVNRRKKEDDSSKSSGSGRSVGGGSF